MNLVNGSSTACEFQLLRDDALMSLVKDGHPEALAILFDRYRRLVLSVAWHILRDYGEAEDLVQSVFLEILQSASKFDSTKGTAKSWILQYAYHRSFNRKKYLNLRGITQYTESFSPAQEPVAAPCSGPFEVVESTRFVKEALERLSGKQRRILELAFFEGLSMREAAERTGQSFNAVRHHFYRAIRDLRSVLRSRPEARMEDRLDQETSLCLVTANPIRQRSPQKVPSLRRAPLLHARLRSSPRPEIVKASLVRA